MSKLIRFDEDHFGYLLDVDVRPDQAQAMSAVFQEAWPGKRIIVMHADEFIDLTGQYEIIPIASGVVAEDGLTGTI